MRICTLASGSSGNSIFIEGDKSSILVDAGLSGKAIEEKLNAIGRSCQDLSAVIVTHEHLDHIKGVGVISRRYDLPIAATEGTWAGMNQIGKIAEQNRVVLDANGLEWDGLKMEVFNTCHDATEPIGVSLYDKNQSMAILTDTGSVYAGMKKHLAGVDVLICESNHDEDMLAGGRYPWHLKKRILSENGHLSNRTAGKILVKLIPTGVREVVLAHLSQENNTPQLAWETVTDILTEAGINVEEDIGLHVAPRNNPGKLFEIND